MNVHINVNKIDVEKLNRLTELGYIVHIVSKHPIEKETITIVKEPTCLKK